MEDGTLVAAAYDGWAEYYDATDADRRPFVEFYSTLVADDTRSILEIGCGTGKILTAMVNGVGGGQRLCAVGVDASIGMLRIAAGRNPSGHWILGDMRAPPVRGPFDVVFCCFNTLQHLLHDADLARCFASVRDLLAIDGVFAFDVYQPNVEYLSIVQSDRLARAITDERGRRLEILESTTYDPRTRLLDLRWRLVQPDRPEAPPLAATHYHVRQYFAEDIERTLEAAGLVMRERFGDLDRSTFDARSRKQVVISVRRDSRHSPERFS
jgi:SAM-dependent methyltransferase